MANAHTEWSSSNSSEKILNIEYQKKAEVELNETPENLKKEIIALKALLLKDKNLNVPDDEEFLLRFLRARKFDSKKAFSVIQRYYLMKLKCPELFRYALPSEYEKVFELQAQYMLPDRDQEGRRIYIMRVDFFDATHITTEDVFLTTVLALEHVVKEPETQICGIVIILDLAGLSLQHAKFFTPYYAKKLVQIVQETFPLRFKGFHVVNEPFYFDAFMAIVKPFLKEKMKNRIHLHGTDISSLHNFIPRDILPRQYGGNGGDFNNRSWYRQLVSDEKYFLAQQQYGYRVDDFQESID